MNIILPIDFSETTDILLQGAIKFAKAVQGKLHLIHVTPTDVGFVIGDAGFQYFPEVEQAEMRHELRTLKELETQISSQGVPCTHILKQGPAREVVIDFAHDLGADYIVVGTHGHSGLYDVFVGSLTKDLTQHTDIPLLVIPCRHK